MSTEEPKEKKQDTIVIMMENIIKFIKDPKTISLMCSLMMLLMITGALAVFVRNSARQSIPATIRCNDFDIGKGFSNRPYDMRYL